MNFTEEEVTWAIGKIIAMQHMKGFPANQEGIEAVAKGVLRIAHPYLVSSRVAGSVPEKNRDNWPDKINDAVIPQEKLGLVKPVDWLVETCLDTFTFFPSLRQMRAVFTKYFPAADGQDIGPEPVKDKEGA